MYSTSKPHDGDNLRLEDHSKTTKEGPSQEKISLESLSLAELTSIIDYHLLWVHFDETCELAEHSKNGSGIHCISREPLIQKLATPWSDCKLNHGGVSASKSRASLPWKEVFFAMKVHYHKTATEDPARVVMDKGDHARISLYMGTVWKSKDTCESPLLFVLSGGRPLNKLSSRLKAVGNWYGLNLPSAS